MKERPIIFYGNMVRAILDGNKTQTRRVIKPKWSRCLDLEEQEDCTKAVSQCPYGQQGDRLWVRETHGIQLESGIFEDYPNGYVIYKADLPDGATFDYEGGGSAWRPSIHMPRWASRIILEIINVKVQRLKDIKPGGAWAEGIIPPYYKIPGTIGGDLSVITCFIEYWDSIYAKQGYGWDVNPWVWVIEFRRIG